MLSAQDNALITQTNKGTPMGELFRRFWLPVMLPEELPEPDCPPVRIKIMGEYLVAFRDTSGRVGIIEAFCPHRRAPLFYGRNEENGLRCVYHGWKFDVTGACVDMPSEPADSDFSEKVTADAYPVQEWGGVIWVYMGPRDKEPPTLPQLEWALVPPAQRRITKNFQECNYLQALEGDIDTAHVSYLHSSKKIIPQNRGVVRDIGRIDKAPKLMVLNHDTGFACAPAAPATSSAPTGVPGRATSATEPAALPTYVPFSGPKPDYPPSADGVVPAGYLTFPSNLVTSSTGPVGKAGDEVSFLTYSINPTPAPVDSNPAWQQVNKDLGLNLKFTYTALQDYNVKLNTVLASGQLPDIFSMNVLDVLIPSEMDFFASQCADLTPHLAGDAIKAFPNLANLPQFAWRAGRFNGKFYALPRVVNAVGPTLLAQQNLLDDIGLKDIKSRDDFVRAVKETSRGGVYGIGGVQAQTMQWPLEMFRAPNKWRESGGKFTRDWETPEYRDAVAMMRSLWDGGYVHPDTPTFIQQQGAQSFYAGKFGMYPTNYFAFGIAWDRLLGINKNFRLTALPPVGFDGGRGVQFQEWGGNQITVLKKGSPERVKQVLGVLNYLAAPFGTTEYLNQWYGQQGVDFTFDGKGNPVYTDAGRNNVQYIAWQTIISAPAVLYDALDPNFVKVAHPIETAVHDLAVTDPTVGLYSATNANKGARLQQDIWDGVNQILFGRADISSLDGIVQSWRQNGGDQIRNEYEDAFASSRT